MSTQVAEPPRLSRRAAAIVALAAPPLAIAAGLETAVQHFATFAVLLVAVPLITLFFWYALTRRGPLRWLAALLALLTALLAVLIGLSLFLTQAALIVVFALAGRYALGPDTAALITGHVPSRPVGAARHGVLLINPRSGGGVATRTDLAARATERGIRTVTLGPGDDLADLAEQAVRDGADVLGMAGGDGSQALVAAAAMRHGIAFVCVPAGTRNHLALDLGLDRADVPAALEAFTDGVERVIDLGSVNGRVFVNNASLGVYAEVVRSSGYRGAKIRTWGRRLPDLLGPAARPPDLEFDTPDSKRHSGVSLLLVSNNPYDMSRVGRAGGRPRLDTGRLGVLTARIRGPVLDVIAARLNRFADVMQWTPAEFEVRSAADVPVGLDGEAVVLTPPLRFTSLPGALRVRVPRRSSPARRGAALTRHDLTALARIAAGRPIRHPDLTGP